MKTKTMYNILITALIGIVMFVGGRFSTPAPTIWDKIPENFGATNFPTSLDSLTNPGPTDSVAVVSHSAQHSNANDAIEAIEAKMGTGASTPTANTVFFGNGVGSSAWSATPSLTSLSLSTITASGLGTFGNVLSVGSSTIVGGLTITGNSTTTNATSTIGAFTGFATSTGFYGAGLQTCPAGNVLTWLAGTFSCAATSFSAIPNISLATSSNTSYLASTTAMTIGQKITWDSTCQRGAGTETLTVGYKLANEAATTTVFQYSGGAGDNPTGFGLFVATTSVTITVDMTAANGCDQGAILRTTLYK